MKRPAAGPFAALRHQDSAQEPGEPLPSSHRMMGAERSFVTVGRSFTVAKGFSPLRKGGFVVPLAALGDVVSGLAPGALKVEMPLAVSPVRAAEAPVDRHSR